MKIIKIGAIWCPGCLVMKKVWNNITSDIELDIQELDYDMDNDEVSKYNVGNVLPVLIFIDNAGNELERVVGEKTENELRGLINKYR